MKKNNQKILLAVLPVILLPLLIFAYYIPLKEEPERTPTEIVYQGATSGQYSDLISLEAKLISESTGEGLEGKEVTFTLGEGAQEISAVTNEQGIANTNLALNQGGGDYTILAIFSGDEDFYGSSDSASFNISKEDTSLAYTGPRSTSEVSGSTITLEAELSELDEEIGDLSGKNISFTIDSYRVWAITDSQGIAEKEVNLSDIPSDTSSFVVEFEEDPYYLSSSDTIDYEGGGEGGDGCFIATVAFGSPLASELDTLRKFRDQYLLTNPLGKQFVSKYYQYSPPLADYIRERENLRKIIRIGLKPVVESIRLLVN